MKNYFIVAQYCFFLLAGLSSVHAQNVASPATVKITGEVTNPLELKAADLKAYPQTRVTRKDKDNKDHVYSGVTLSALLQKAGVPSGKELRGKNLTNYILAEAADGYQVVFALAELDQDFTDRAIILADEMDGKPLPTGDGPFRIIVQNEKKPARCVKMLIGLKVESAK